MKCINCKHWHDNKCDKMPDAFVAPYTLACASIEPRPHKYTLRAVSPDSVMLTSKDGVCSFPISLSTSFQFRTLREVLVYVLSKSCNNDIVSESDVVLDQNASELIKSKIEQYG